MKGHILVLALLLGAMSLIAPLTVWCQAGARPIVRAEVTPAQVNVGQPVKLRVEVLVPTWLARPSIYPPFELANAITRLPSESSRPFSERIGNDTWSGVARTYEIYPQLAARFEMTQQTVQVSYANPGAAPLVADVPVPDLSFRAVVPAGAEGLSPYLGGTRVALEREVQGELSNLAVGGAVVFSVTATIEGMPAQFLPPLIPLPEVAGLKAYPREARLIHGPFASRTETVTWLLTAGGDFALPSIELDWWNTGAGRVERASLPALPFSVAGPPITAAAETSTAMSRAQRLELLLLAALALLGAFAGWRLWPRLRDWLARRRAAYLASEAHAFRELQAAVKRCDLQQTDWWLSLWRERLDPDATLEEISRRAATPALQRALASIREARYAPHGPGSDQDSGYGELARALQDCRSGYLRWLAAAAAKPALPTLNPR